MDKNFCRAIVTDKKNPYKKRACRNYACTGTNTCYPHRKMETPEYHEKVIKDMVKAAIDKVIYDSRMDYIRIHGWEKYVKKLAKNKI